MTEEKDFGMTGSEIFGSLSMSLEINPEQTDIHMSFAHTQMLWLHSRVIACHCECLGMNAENMWAAIANADPVYRSGHYYEIMQKWGLSNEKGEPLI